MVPCRSYDEFSSYCLRVGYPVGTITAIRWVEREGTLWDGEGANAAMCEVPGRAMLSLPM